MELIVACTPEGIIGDGISLPWHIPEDLRRFKRLTTGHIIVMGRKTYDSLPQSPLPNRIHVVISHIDTPTISPNVYIANESDARSILKYLHELHPDKKIFIIGGSQIYNMFFYDCSTFHITLVSSPIPPLQSPVVFKGISQLRENTNHYGKTYESEPNMSEKSGIMYSYITYTTNQSLL